jgi:hypothetical protein
MGTVHLRLILHLVGKIFTSCITPVAALADMLKAIFDDQGAALLSQARAYHKWLLVPMVFLF